MVVMKALQTHSLRGGRAHLGIFWEANESIQGIWATVLWEADECTWEFGLPGLEELLLQ